MSSPPDPPMKVKTEAFRCDVCKEAVFDTYEMAYRHEMRCQGDCEQKKQRTGASRTIPLDEGGKAIVSEPSGLMGGENEFPEGASFAGLSEQFSGSQQHSNISKVYVTSSDDVSELSPATDIDAHKLRLQELSKSRQSPKKTKKIPRIPPPPDPPLRRTRKHPTISISSADEVSEICIEVQRSPSNIYPTKRGSPPPPSNFVRNVSKLSMSSAGKAAARAQEVQRPHSQSSPKSRKLETINPSIPALVPPSPQTKVVRKDSKISISSAAEASEMSIELQRCATIRLYACDKCGLEFRDYDKACRHEEGCQGSGKGTTSPSRAECGSPSIPLVETGSSSSSYSTVRLPKPDPDAMQQILKPDPDAELQRAPSQSFARSFSRNLSLPFSRSLRSQKKSGDQPLQNPVPVPVPAPNSAPSPALATELIREHGTSTTSNNKRRKEKASVPASFGPSQSDSSEPVHSSKQPRHGGKLGRNDQKMSKVITGEQCWSNSSILPLTRELSQI